MVASTRLNSRRKPVPLLTSVRGVGVVAMGLAVALGGGGCDGEHDLGTMTWTPPAVASDLSCLVVADQPLDFGLVGDDTVGVEALEVANTCETAVELVTVVVRSDDEFWLLAPPAGAPADWVPAGIAVGGAWASTTLGPGEAMALRIAFRGTHHRALADGVLELQARSPRGVGRWEVPLRANTRSHCLEVTPSGPLDLGCRAVGVSHQVSLSMTACGGLPVHVEGVTLNGDQAFEVFDGGKRVITPGESVLIDLVYSPQAASDVRPAIVWSEAAVTVYAGPASKSAPVWSDTLRAFARAETCEGLDVEVTWATPGDPDPTDVGPEARPDLDLHFMHAHSVGWFHAPFDAFWFNRSPSWGDFGDPADDPRMTIDVIHGSAREAMTMSLPEDGRAYRIGVHHWADRGMGPSDVTVTVRYFGEPVFQRTVRLSERDLWDVGLVQWPEGTVITANGDEPVVIPHYAAPCDPTGCKGK